MSSAGTKFWRSLPCNGFMEVGQLLVGGGHSAATGLRWQRFQFQLQPTTDRLDKQNTCIEGCHQYLAIKFFIKQRSALIDDVCVLYQIQISWYRESFLTRVLPSNQFKES